MGGEGVLVLKMKNESSTIVQFRELRHPRRLGCPSGGIGSEGETTSVLWKTLPQFQSVT